MKAIRLVVIGAALIALWAQTPIAHAQTSNVVSDTFTGTAAQLQWASFNGACLTAGAVPATGTIPTCSQLAYYGSQVQTGLTNNADTAGNGALRLTNGCASTCYYDQNGAIISTTPFSSAEGIQVTFTTYTYGGDDSGGHGADGIGFYLLSGTDAAKVSAAAANPSNTGGTNTWTLGSWGGSLGYSCSNTNSPYPGMTDAYIGLGMDEFGNFLNAGDNTGTGALNSANATSGTGVQTGPYSGTTSGGGPEYQPGRIGLRGYGNINLISLQAVNPSATAANVQTVCSNGGSYSYTSGYTTTYSTVWSNTYSNNGTHTYTGTLYQKSGSSTYTAKGTASTTSDGYTGTGTPYGKVSGNYYAVTITSTQVATQNPITSTATFADYAAIPNGYVNLPSTTPLANESATSRASATPVSYKLQITQDGLLSLWYSWNGGNYIPVLTSQSIASSNGTMPSSFLFGFGGSTGGSDNVHEITCFQATPATLAASSVGINVQETSQVDTGTQIYLGFYHTNNWWGQLQSIEVFANSDGSITLGTTPNWDASCVLTGGACASTGVTGMTAQGTGSRNLVTWSGTAGIPLTWGRLTTTEQGWLNNDSEGANRTAYLQGDRTNEVTTGGTGLFRARTSVLGDIIDSSPTWVGPPSTDYPNSWQDLLYPTQTASENSGQTYSTFMTNYASRINVVYEGANDGFMHGFETGYYNASGNYVGTTSNGVFTGTYNDGYEMIGYMPQAVLQTIHNTSDSTLDFSSTHYAHNYYVDSTPGTGDLYYGGVWHTWLVSGLGAGGNAIFALDVTNPTSITAGVPAGGPGSSTLGVGNVIGEWSNSSNSPLVCGTDTTSSQCMTNLGQTYGTPQIRRLHNGEWGVIFGNGLNSSTGVAGIYVMTINSSGGVDTVYFLSTGVGAPAGSSNAEGPNGIAYVTPADLDGDHITDYVYAGDVYGNVWRFDLTSSNPAKWAVTSYPNSVNGALFSTPTTTYSTTVNGNTVRATTYQPISTQVLALATEPVTNGKYYVMLEFGTGSVQPQTSTTAISYAAGQQALYGIWDWMQGGASGTPGTTYAGLTGTSEPASGSPITQSTLEQQVATTLAAGSYTSSNTTVQGYRTVTQNTICFVGMTCSTSAGTQYGWYMNLPGYTGVPQVGVNPTTGVPTQTEQVIYNPVELDGAFIVDTTIPANNSPLTCSALTAAGWTMALNPAEGGAFTESFFEAPAGTFTQVNGASVAGVALNATGSASILSVGSQANLVYMNGGGGGGGGGGGSQKVNPQQTANGSRVTWIQLH
jgi:type IV pilus assembly protein PilY1